MKGEHTMSSAVFADGSGGVVVGNISAQTETEYIFIRSYCIGKYYRKSIKADIDIRNETG